MEMPAESAGSDVLIEYGVFTLAALGGDSGAGEIATAFDAKQEALRAAQRGRIGANEAVIAAGALAGAAEITVENVMRKVETRALERAGKKRKQEPYAGLFPGNLEGALAPTGRAQATEATRIAELIAPAEGRRHEGVTDEIAALAPELREAVTALLTRITSLEAAETAAVAAFGAELTLRRQWREQYRKTHALLTARYPSDKRKVEAAFRAGKKTKKKG